MKHKLLIWSKNKKTNTHIIESHVEVDETDIEDLAMLEYEDSHGLDDDREYWAVLDETIH